MELYLNYFSLLHLRAQKMGNHMAASAGTQWKLLDRHFSCRIQKLLGTDYCISELIFASGIMPLDN